MKDNLLLMLVLFLIALSGVCGFIFSYYQHNALPKPPDVTGDVQLIETYHYPALFVKQLQGDPDAGRKIFKQFCTSCHGNPPLIDINAPHIGDKKAWDLRRKMGMTMLMKITTSGVGAMPARGGCFECSDEQLQQAIKYILRNSHD